MASVTERIRTNLRQFRREEGLSQEEMSVQLGFHRTYIGMVERGDREPTISILQSAQDVFGLDPINLVQPINDESSIQ